MLIILLVTVIFLSAVVISRINWLYVDTKKKSIQLWLDMEPTFENRFTFSFISFIYRNKALGFFNKSKKGKVQFVTALPFFLYMHFKMYLSHLVEYIKTY
jgi:hypothetical protein